MPNLITIQDIQEMRPLAQLDVKRVDPYITEAQENDLRPVLGDALFYDFVTNYTQTKYRTLLNGSTYSKDGYTIFFPGVKPMLCYFALARITQNNAINLTSYGAVQKTVQGSEAVDARVLGALVTELRDVANSYQSIVVEFLQNDPTAYPLYNATSSKSESSFGLNFFSA